MQRDRIDFGRMNIPVLFRKIFFPTLLGMVCMACITIADGIFVGRGVGSNALAAVNIVAPIFMVTTGIGLLFGVGSSVVASVHLSQRKVKAANINVTQALLVSLLLMAMGISLVMLFNKQTAYMLGSSDQLLPLVLEYMNWIVPFSIFSMLANIGMFMIRLDGSPKFAMLCNVIPALINVVLDYVFVFPIQMGLTGAALATALAQAVGGLMVLVYLFGFSRTLHLYRLKISMKSLHLTCRNTGYMIQLGASAMLGELAIACMMLVGNYAFIRMLKEDGVAAYSVACYCLPIVFMIANAIAQSAQPIISYNYGTGNAARVHETFRLSLKTAFISGLTAFAVMYVFCPYIVAMFLEPGCPAYGIATKGIPYFASGFICFALNIAWIGYYQSIELARKAMLFMLLRGIILMRKGAMAGCSVCRTDHLYRTDDRLPIPAQDMQSGEIRQLSFGIPHHPLYCIVHLSDGLQTECHAMQIAFGDGKTDGTFTFCIRNMFAFTENFHSDKPFTFFAGLT